MEKRWNAWIINGAFHLCVRISHRGLPVNPRSYREANDPPMIRPWLLSELNYGHVTANPPAEVAVLPLGATEPHNLHLPYGTDTYQVALIGARERERAYDQGARVVM